VANGALLLVFEPVDADGGDGEVAAAADTEGAS
jgi:hypothetical protein